MNNNISKDVIILRLNDINNKIKNLDKRMSILSENLEYTNIKINEIHDEIFNNIVNIPSRNISPIKSPRYNSSSSNRTNYRNSNSNKYSKNKIQLRDISRNYEKMSSSSSEELSPCKQYSQAIPQKADDTYLGVQTSINTSPYFPEIRKNRNRNRNINRNTNTNTNRMISRHSFDSMNSLNSNYSK